MTDREILENHLNKYYTFCLTHKLNTHVRYEELRNSLMVRSELEEDIELSELGLIREITSIYGNFLTEENVMVEEMVREWFKKNIHKSFDKIFDTLKGVEVIFGPRSWEVKKNGVDYDLNELVEEYKDSYSPKVIKAVFDEWKHNEIMRISDEILNS